MRRYGHRRQYALAAAAGGIVASALLVWALASGALTLPTSPARQGSTGAPARQQEGGSGQVSGGGTATPRSRARAAIPTRTPDPRIAQEAAYARAWTGWAGRYSSALAKVGELSDRPDPWNPQWVSSVQAQLNEIQAVNVEVLGYGSPPARYAEAHDKLKTAASMLDDASRSFWQGANTLDIGLITQSLAGIEPAMSQLQNAIDTWEAASGQSP